MRKEGSVKRLRHGSELKDCPWHNLWCENVSGKEVFVFVFVNYRQKTNSDIRQLYLGIKKKNSDKLLGTLILLTLLSLDELDNEVKGKKEG